MAGLGLDTGWMSVVHNYHWHSHRHAVLQVCYAGVFPFGKEIRYGSGVVSLFANIAWLIISGIPLALSAAINGVLLCCTIIGIPFGKQCFKIAQLALLPFGASVLS